MDKKLEFLLLEDEPADAELAERELRKAGMVFSSRRVDSRDAFVAALEELRPDVILADFNLPAFDGLSALGIVRAKMPEVPFIFISGAMGEETAIDTLHQGAADYVLKGHLSKLVPAVKRALLNAEEHRRRKTAEEALRKSEMALNEAQRLAHIGSWEWDALKDTIWWSDEYYRIYGLDPGKPTSNYAEHLKAYTPESAGRLDAAVKRAMETGESYELDLELVLPTDSTRWILARGEAKCDANGNIRGLRGTAQNITERKRMEEALRERTQALLRSNADLEQFAYSVSHDMRQPLRMITGHLQLLEHALKDRLDADNRENMAFVLDGARRMDAMIVSLLEYSRVGRTSSLKTWMASRESLDEALNFLAPLMQETGTELRVVGDWPNVYACRDELTRLFQNLIGNAVKYRIAGTFPRIEVESSHTAGTWRISVRDHGIGIDPQQIDRLFKLFSRLQSRSRFEGTGMGLALCRRIVEHHEGRIWATSAGEGQGSAFNFEIPLKPPEPSTEKEQHSYIGHA
ncbi:MAG: ATP-binding protein [Sterolibacterium sp.]